MASFDQYVDVATGREISAVYLQSRRYWIADGQSVHVIQTAGWCDDCENVVAVEHLPSESEIDYETRQLTAIIEGRSSDYSLFFDSPDGASARLAERKRLWTAFESRKSPARCLACYGTHIQLLPSKVGDCISLPNGLSLRYVAHGFADIGPEPEVWITIDGTPVGHQKR